MSINTEPESPIKVSESDLILLIPQRARELASMEVRLLALANLPDNVKIQRVIQLGAEILEEQRVSGMQLSTITGNKHDSTQVKNQNKALHSPMLLQSPQLNESPEQILPVFAKQSNDISNVPNAVSEQAGQYPGVWLRDKSDEHIWFCLKCLIILDKINSQNGDICDSILKNGLTLLIMAPAIPFILAISSLSPTSGLSLDLFSNWDNELLQIDSHVQAVLRDCEFDIFRAHVDFQVLAVLRAQYNFQCRPPVPRPRTMVETFFSFMLNPTNEESKKPETLFETNLK